MPLRHQHPNPLLNPRAMDNADAETGKVDSSMARRARPKSPMRTCVGCRRRAAQADLLRVVVVTQGDRFLAVPDGRRQMPGRGAYLHPVYQCLQRAESRQAFTKAFRLGVPVDLQLLRTETGDGDVGTEDQGGTDGEEHAMSAQR